MLKSRVKSVTAFAPATCSNVAVGFDILGFACEHLGDTVTLSLRQDDQLVIEHIESPDPLPTIIEQNTAGAVVKAFRDSLNEPVGFNIRIKKGIPLSSGLGGSAASAVAAAIACNAFLTTPLSKNKIIELALTGEAVASGLPHADNIAPAVYGGFTLVRSMHPVDIFALPVVDLYCLLIHPHLKIDTKSSRLALNHQVPLKDFVQQSANLAGFIAGLYEKNYRLIQQCLTDVIIEPQRAHLVPGFYELKKLALENGALGFSLSGSGPTLFALMTNLYLAEKVSEALQSQLQQDNMPYDIWISKINTQGARVEQVM